MSETIDYKTIQELAQNMESCFSFNPDDSKNAYLTWRMRNGDTSGRFKMLSGGYLEIAQKEIKELLVDNSARQADIYIFPILFDLVHGIELGLKSLNYRLRHIVGEQDANISCGGHKIQKISTDTKKLFFRFEKLKKLNVEQPITATKLICNFINNIYKHTDNMSFARYPLDSHGKDMFYIKDDKIIVIDLDMLQAQVKYVIRMLDFLDEFIDRTTEDYSR